MQTEPSPSSPPFSDLFIFFIYMGGLPASVVGSCCCNDDGDDDEVVFAESTFSSVAVASMGLYRSILLPRPLQLLTDTAVLVVVLVVVVAAVAAVGATSFIVLGGGVGAVAGAALLTVLLLLLLLLLQPSTLGPVCGGR